MGSQHHSLDKPGAIELMKYSVYYLNFALTQEFAGKSLADH